MRTAINLVLALSLVLGTSAFAEIPDPREMTFAEQQFTPPATERFVLDNGMVVHFLPATEPPVITVEVLFHAGTLYEPKKTVGVFELMATAMRTAGAGERGPTQMDSDLEALAASISSSAGDEQVSFSMRSLAEDFGQCLGLLRDILLEPAFDSAVLARETSNKRDWILRQNDNPGSVTRRVYYQTVYADHPYANYATLESIDRIDRDLVLERHRRFIRPDNCILAVAGAISLEDLQTHLDQAFGEWQADGSPLPKMQEWTGFGSEPGVYYAEKDINQANFRFGHLCLDHKHPDRHAFEVMNFALGGSGFTSRLTKQVRTTAGLAYSVGSWHYNRAHAGTFFGYCQTRADQFGKALNMMLDIVAEVHGKGITQEELDLAHSSLTASYVFNYTTPARIVNAKAQLEFSGFPEDQLERDLEGLKAVTLEDCRRVAREHLDPDKVIIVVTGKRDMFDSQLEDLGKVTVVDMEIK